jgi:Cu2+-containing amine oxidase
MTSEKARRLSDLVIDLNKLVIDQNDKVKSEQELLKQCYTLKKEALEKRSLETAKLFIHSADELSLARDAFIKIMTAKNEKQIEIIESLKRSDLIEKRDLEEIAAAIFVDALASAALIPSIVSSQYLPGRWGLRHDSTSQLSFVYPD